MTIRTAILGFLGRGPLSGYDLKLRFRDDRFLPWSGNNNQVYRTLTELHREGLVELQVVTPRRGPARKVYSLTGQGQSTLRDSLLADPELPELRHPFLARLLVSQTLSDAEIRSLLHAYLRGIEEALAMGRETLRRLEESHLQEPQTSGVTGMDARSAFIAAVAQRRWIATYETELAWAEGLAEALTNRKGGDDDDQRS